MNRVLGALRAPSAIVWITLLAFSARIVLVLVRHDWSNPEAWEYGIVAQNLLDGNGFSGSAWFVPEGPTAFMAPVYVFLLYGVQAVFGGAGFAVLQFAQAGIGALCVWLVYHIAARLFDPLTAAIAALVLALHPTHAYLTTVIHPLVVITCTLLASIVCVMRFRDAPDAKNAVIAGVMYGFALLTDPAILCIVPVIAIAMLTKLDIPIVQRMGWTAIVIGIAVLTVSPWTVRNYLVFDRFVPVKSQLGYILWVGNHEGASGTQTIIRADATIGHVNERLPEDFVAELAEMPEPDAYSAVGAVAVDYMLNHPAETAIRTVKKAGYYWVFPYWFVDPADRDRPFLAHLRRPEEILWFVVLLPAIAGVVLRRNHLMAALFTLMPCACYTALYALTNIGSNPRYRIPIEPLVMVWTAVAIVWILTRSTESAGEES